MMSDGLTRREGSAAFTPAGFEHLVTEVMSRHYSTPLHHGRIPGVPKDFDMVSTDGSIVGDAKYLALIRGENLPPTKFSMIAEHVWLLEKTRADHKFLVFGNQKEVPNIWLNRYGHMVEGIEFYFLSNNGKLERLR